MDSEKQYWQSYNVTSTTPLRISYYPSLNSQHTVHLSVVLDCEARYNFSAIRLLVFCEHSIFPEDLVITGYDDLGEFSLGYSTALRRRHASRLSVKQHGNRQAELSLGKVCVIAFTVFQPNSFSEFNITQTTVQPSSNKPILYDYTCPISFYNPSALAHLYFYRPAVSHPVIEPSYEHSTHSIRILPIPSRRKDCCATLPSSIIHHIVLLAIQNEWFQAWKQHLLSYALVCKAWEHVLGIFFEHFGDRELHWEPMSADLILRTLRWRPQLGTLIRHLSYDHFNTSWVPANDLSLWQNFFEIMEYTTTASYFYLPNLPRDLLDEKLEVLCNLREIRECVFGHHSPWISRDRDAMSMAYIQIVIMKWKKLKKLSIIGWGKAREHNSKRARRDLECSIEQLQLHRGYLTSDQLLYFSTSAHCNLSKIDFVNLTGPFNADFQRFLSTAAATLETIKVIGCHFTPCYHGEELALDAVMPEMTALQDLWVSDNVISTLVLLRKPSTPGASSIITIQCDYSSIEIEDFEDTIPVTQWGAIHVYGIPWDWHPPIVDRVEQTAFDRGVEISMVEHNLA